MKQESQVVWHAERVSDVLAQLDTSIEAGLRSEQATARLAQYGRNELESRGGRSPWRILWEQFTATMVLILLVAAIASAMLQKWHEAIAIGAIVVLFGLLGFFQEYRAEKALAALKKMSVPLVRVRRNGAARPLEATELVLGDIVLLEAGNLVPADLRLVEAINLRIQEAALTGEAEAVEKQAAVLATLELPLGDRQNMAYMSSTVSYGRGAGVVIATGMTTELGKIAELLQSVRDEMTPLQKRLDQAGKWLAVAGVVTAVLVGAIAWYHGSAWIDIFLLGVSIAVAVVPEGLPAVVTITLALGARRMLARNALVRKLPAVETLGSVTVICSDKTGTLTENRMKATLLDVADHHVDLASNQNGNGTHGNGTNGSDTNGNNRTDQTRVALSVLDDTDSNEAALHLLLIGGALCNDAELRHEAQGAAATGDPTETALVMAAVQFGLYKDELEKAMPRLGEIPFDSERKRMTTWHDMGVMRGVLPEIGPTIAFTKGAVDGLLEITDSVWVQGEIVPLNADYRARIQAAQNLMASNGMRVLGVAFQPVNGMPVTENALTYIGCTGIIDPPRSEVKDAVAKCRTAGIRTVMITGDHPLTAISIAKQLNLVSDQDRVITGVELDRMDDAQFRHAAETVNVFARVAPEHKLRIVEALQQRGQIVAMTGDGVNDAPALKQANIGVAMGITGTDVSKEASDMVLRDDNFATIVAAVEEGRVIYDNLRKFLKFSIGGNLGKILIMIIGGLAGMPVPLQPLQLLWLNLLTDGLLGVGLGVEPPERNVMQRPPVPADAGVFSDGMGGQIVRMGIVIGAAGLGIGYWAWLQGIESWQTLAFTTIAFSQVWQAFGVRTSEEPLWERSFSSNPTLLSMAGLVVLLQLSSLYVPFLQEYLRTVPLSGFELLLCAVLSLVVLIWAELEKWMLRKSKAATSPTGSTATL